jgi:hypothetical protein
VSVGFEGEPFYFAFDDPMGNTQSLRLVPYTRLFEMQFDRSATVAAIVGGTIFTILFTVSAIVLGGLGQDAKVCFKSTTEFESECLAAIVGPFHYETPSLGFPLAMLWLGAMWSIIAAICGCYGCCRPAGEPRFEPMGRA